MDFESENANKRVKVGKAYVKRDGTKKAVISIAKLPEATVAKLIAEAEEKGITANGLIRDIIDNHYNGDSTANVNGCTVSLRFGKVCGGADAKTAVSLFAQCFGEPEVAGEFIMSKIAEKCRLHKDWECASLMDEFVRNVTYKSPRFSYMMSIEPHYGHVQFQYVIYADEHGRFVGINAFDTRGVETKEINLVERYVEEHGRVKPF